MNSPNNSSFTPFVEHLGAEFVRAEGGSSEILLRLQPHHLNGLGVAHGGVVMTLLDVTMALAARSADPANMAVVTIEMKTSFLRPAKGELHAFGDCDHRSTSMAFCRAVLKDEAGRLLAQAMGTFRRMPVVHRPSRASGALAD
ncbi:MAG: hypothetical protein RL483_21 [Pseudomonadota bacterium]|jgi:uncharacterized protein (TIGR00369 family)